MEWSWSLYRKGALAALLDSLPAVERLNDQLGERLGNSKIHSLTNLPRSASKPKKNT